MIVETALVERLTSAGARIRARRVYVRRASMSNRFTGANTFFCKIQTCFVCALYFILFVELLFFYSTLSRRRSYAKPAPDYCVRCLQTFVPDNIIALPNCCAPTRPPVIAILCYSPRARNIIYRDDCTRDSGQRSTETRRDDQTDRQREIHYVHSASLAYEDESVFMS